MRILHTADWHLGKRLGRHDRRADHAAAIDRIVAVADQEAVDLVLVAGDVFDRAIPPVDALRLALDGLRRLARDRAVVAIAGNHDSPELFEVLAPLVRSEGIHLVGQPRAPDDGGVLRLDLGGETALVGCLPFIRLGRVVDFLADLGSWRGQYADRMAAACRAFDAYLARHGEGCVRLFMAHFMVAGIELPGGARGERALHVADAYATGQDALGAGASYVAMGHIHLPQAVPGAPVPARYAGSPIALDFGEAGEAKQVLIVDASARRMASIRSVPITAGRQLVRARGTLEALVARTDLADAFLDLTVVTEGPDPGLADRAKTAFPNLVKVRLAYPRQRVERPTRVGRDWTELYAEYVRSAHETEPDPALLEAFRLILDDVDAAA